MGSAFAAKGQFELALKRFDETLASIPPELKNEHWKNLVYAKGDTLFRAGKVNESRETFLQIYEIDVAFKDISKRIDEMSGGPAA